MADCREIFTLFANLTDAATEFPSRAASDHGGGSEISPVSRPAREKTFCPGYFSCQ
jgi:hypothetical protein